MAATCAIILCKQTKVYGEVSYYNKQSEISLWPFLTMKFRQRLAWLLLFLYLFLSLVIVYYCFELSDQYNTMALEHSKLHHSATTQKDSTWGPWSHLPDVPFFLWIFLFAIPYLQVFFCLYVCTKPEPKEILSFVPFLMCSKKVGLKDGKMACVQDC
ncbi:hypothetical protein JTE90_004405 [Oedothorax gibbosus]|uniref:Lysosomal enzyme trafficking factor n=1 Tax=Oedothorax gibbosus TaxID=931172 RepID=A0AAV6UQ94_9ARAC|nr:hypothetical protein JTE90_004405 [Oedothorax gibbosus]